MFSDVFSVGFDMQNAGGLDECNHVNSYTLHSLDVANQQRVKLEPSGNSFTCVVQQPTVDHQNNKRKAEEMHHHHHLLVGPTMDNGTSTNGVQANESQQTHQPQRKTMPPNGKKTKGRVKIKMEFIDNKLRRYTTFSKRKTGIMKKAYELSTLTGTQVMLLVASETGHVYTFATRKLQPMITSEAGKALIQTCLNSPDPPLGPGGPSGLDQRMSATGFEEVDLTYTVAEDTENKEGVVRGGSYICLQPQTQLQHQGVGPGGSEGCSSGDESAGSCSSPDSPEPAPGSPGAREDGPSQQSLTADPKAFTSLITPSAARSSNSPSLTSGQQHAVYRLPTGPLVSIPTSAASIGSPNTTTVGSSSPGVGSTSSAGQAVAVLPGSPQNLSLVSVLPSTGSGGSVQVYQTAQGVVYAATGPSASNLPEGVILNLHTQDNRGTGQQYITIPVPVTLTNHQQISHLVQSQVTSLLLPSGSRKEKSRNK